MNSGAGWAGVDPRGRHFFVEPWSCHVMHCYAGAAAAGLALLVTLTSGHATDSRSLSHAVLPSDQTLAPLGIRKLWHATVPTSGARDYLVKVQLLGDTLVAQTDGGGLSAIDGETGRILWQTRFEGVRP